MEKIGIFGGTFNPVHIGHLRAAEQAAKALSLDRVLLIPAKQTPGKARPAGSPTDEQRMELLRLAVKDCPLLEASDMDLQRPGETFTWDTVRELRQQHPEAALFLLLGSDMFLHFLHWRHAEEISREVTLVPLCRGIKGEMEAISAKIEEMKACGMKVEPVCNESIAVSSTQLRRLMAFGSGETFINGEMLAYIRRNGLYFAGADWKRMTMEQLEPIVISLLNPNRVKHVLGCRDTAVELARRWGADESDAARAGILHDITKALDGPLQLTLCDSYGRILSDFSRKYPKTLHALTGSLVADRIFGENEAVVSAICWHTTGKADMNLLEMIIYVADYMEPNRDFPGVEQLRELAFSDIRAALKLGLEMTLVHLHNQGSEVSPESREALEFLNKCE